MCVSDQGKCTTLMIAVLTHLPYWGNTRPPHLLKVLLPWWVAIFQHINVHVYQPVTLFSYFMYIEHSSKVSAKGDTFVAYL